MLDETFGVEEKVKKEPANAEDGGLCTTTCKEAEPKIRADLTPAGF